MDTWTEIVFQKPHKLETNMINCIMKAKVFIQTALFRSFEQGNSSSAIDLTKNLTRLKKLTRPAIIKPHGKHGVVARIHNSKPCTTKL